MVIGWLHDDIGIVGGAERSERALRDATPEWVDAIVLCPPNRRPPLVDAFVIQNSLTYEAQWIEVLSQVPVIKVIRDGWHTGSLLLRRWILDNARLLIFGSEPHLQEFSFPFKADCTLAPPPVDIARFEQAARPDADRKGNVYVGRLEPGKGVAEAVDWALRCGEPLDIWGQTLIPYLNRSELPSQIRFMGPAEYEDVPGIFGAAKRFVFYPARVESFSRTTVEAWAAGCELLVNDNVSAMWWIKNRPQDLRHGEELFWEAVKDAIN